MFKSIKKRLKNQRGLTLVELLAVMVILGIIAAIAVPSIGKVIDNSKDKAQVANAHQIVDAAKLYVNSGEKAVPTTNGGTATIKLSELITEGLLEEIKDPKLDNKVYDAENSLVTIEKGATTLTDGGANPDSGKLIYKITLKTATTGSNFTTYYNAVDIRTLH
jgi:type IV pilus assembly protein PilA